MDFFKPLSIRWSYWAPGRTHFLYAGLSTNWVYVSWKPPVTTNLFHSVVDVACRNAEGQSSESEIVAGTWSDFADLDVRHVDGRQMTYWAGGQKGAADSAQLVARPDANGNCRAWSALLRDAFRVHGIWAHRIMAYPVDDPGLLVPVWDFIDPPSGSGRYPYIAGQDLFDRDSIAGQGNPNPPGVFNVHYIVECLGTYYDPSYGTPSVVGSDRSKRFEGGSSAGYINAFPECSAARRNDTTPGSPSEAAYVTAN